MTTLDAIELEILQNALTAAAARLDALEQPPAEPGADEPPADEEPAGADLEEELVRRDERIDARIDALVRAMKAIEERERTKSSENGKASDPSVVQRQIEAALAGRDAKLDQVEAMVATWAAPAAATRPPPPAGRSRPGSSTAPG